MNVKNWERYVALAHELLTEVIGIARSADNKKNCGLCKLDLKIHSARYFHCKRCADYVGFCENDAVLSL